MKGASFSAVAAREDGQDDSYMPAFYVNMRFGVLCCEANEYVTLSEMPAVCVLGL